MIFLELSLCSVRGGKLGSCWEPSSKVELHDKFLAKRLALSVDVVKASVPLKRVRYGRLPLVKNAVANPPEVTRADKLRCNRVTSCFSVIGPHSFEDPLTVITSITKHFLIESHSDGAMAAAQEGVNHGEE